LTKPSLAEQNINPFIPPPPKAVIRSKTNPSERDKAINYIKEKGYWAWYYKNNFGRRNKVENSFYRLKTIFGRKLNSRTFPNQDAESHLLCCMLNKMTSLVCQNLTKLAEI
jgi:hypothetical protein